MLAYLAIILGLFIIYMVCLRKTSLKESSRGNTHPTNYKDSRKGQMGNPEASHPRRSH